MVRCVRILLDPLQPHARLCLGPTTRRRSSAGSSTTRWSGAWRDLLRGGPPPVGDAVGHGRAARIPPGAPAPGGRWREDQPKPFPSSPTPIFPPGQAGASLRAFVPPCSPPRDTGPDSEARAGRGNPLRHRVGSLTPSMSTMCVPGMRGSPVSPLRPRWSWPYSRAPPHPL
ncbi:Triple functional domain protein [Manis javanica]|nr:Triple functional domain protein [Manis javanica]